jgi:dipeptidyl aminopeptidase/acylaminoacyl peptidase
VGFEGEDEHRFTTGARADASPRWSPDGAYLAFTSDREEAGKHQLYLMSTSGGEAIRLTDLKGGVSTPCWSPDGSLLAFLVKDAESEQEERDKKERKDAILVDENFKYNRLYVVDPQGGEPRQISPAGAVNVWTYDWAPDSQRLVAVTSRSPRVADYREPNDLRIIGVDGTCYTLLTFDSGMSHPIWSPDGQTIAFLAREGRVVSQDALWCVPTDGGEARLLTGGYVGSIWSAEWSADSRELIFIGLEDLYGAINTLRLSSGKIRSRLPASAQRQGSYGTEFSLDRSRKRFAIVYSDRARPPEVWAGVLGASIHQVTHANQSLAAARLGHSEVVCWQSSDGLEIHGLLVYPLDYQEGQRYPLILQIHGGPASFWADRFYAGWHDWAQLLATKGYAVLLANPRGSIGRGAAFTNANFRDLGGMEVQDLMTGIDAMIKRGIADPEQLGVGGWSHGGYLTAWIVTQTDRFKGAVMGAGVANMVSDQGQNDIPGFNLDYFYDDLPSLYCDFSLLWDRSPLKHIAKAKTPTLILHGEKDERVTMAQGAEFYRGLKVLGIPTRFIVYPREPHSIREREHQLDLMRRVLDWFEQHVRARK